MATDEQPGGEDAMPGEDDIVLSGLDLPEADETDATIDEGAAEQAERVAEAERHRDRRGPGFEPY